MGRPSRPWLAWSAVPHSTHSILGVVSPALTPSLDRQAGARQLQTTKHHPAAAWMTTVQHDHGVSQGLDPMSWHAEG